MRIEKRASNGPRKQEWLVMHPDIVSGEYQAPAVADFKDWTSEELARFASYPVPTIADLEEIARFERDISIPLATFATFATNDA